MDKFVITKTTLPSRWRLLSRSDEQKTEILLCIQGIICFKDLPPLQDHRYVIFYWSFVVSFSLYFVRKKKTQDAKFLRQGIQLTGLDSQSFKNAIESITTVHNEFSRVFQEDTIHLWKHDAYLTYPAINIYNRYFYTTQDCPQQASVPFGDNIDPSHKLSALALASGLVHTIDNQVEYFKISQENKCVILIVLI